VAEHVRVNRINKRGGRVYGGGSTAHGCILLYGPSGCGKTYFLKSTANEFKLANEFISCHRLKEQFKEGIKTQLYFKKLFGRARESAPSMIILDDIDEITSQGSLQDLKIRKAVYQLLRELDNIKPGDRLLVTATSDYPHLIEPLLFKARRFDKLIFVPLPNTDAREELFEQYLTDLPIEDDINTKSLARISQGFNGSDIERAIEHAWDLAENEQSDITTHHLEQALKDIRPSSTDDVLEPIKKFFMQYKSGTLGSDTGPSRGPFSRADVSDRRRGRGDRRRPHPGSRRSRRHKPEVEYTIEDTDDVVEFDLEPDSDEAMNVDWSDDSEEEEETVTWESDDEEEIEDWD
jgi:DNA polymerase III delta prime subunit